MESAPRFLPLRLSLGLGAIAGLYAIAIGWSVSTAAGMWPLGGAFSVRLIPQLICALAAAIAVLSPPVLMEPVSTETNPKVCLARMLFSALWQGAVAALFLTLAARLTPLSPSAILRASTWLALCALMAQWVALIFPKPYAAFSFAWLFAMPTLCYFLADIFLMSPAGGNGWAGSSGVHAEFLRAVVRECLHYSPATGAAGNLSGYLADGSPCEGWIPFGVLTGANGVGCLLCVARMRAKPNPNIDF